MGADGDDGAGAWLCPPRRYARENPPTYEGERRSSRYVAVRDGTRLAVDVHPPRTAPDRPPHCRTRAAAA